MKRIRIEQGHILYNDADIKIEKIIPHQNEAEVFYYFIDQPEIERKTFLPYVTNLSFKPQEKRKMSPKPKSAKAVKVAKATKATKTDKPIKKTKKVADGRGRKPKLDDAKKAKLLKMVGKVSPREICEKFGVSLFTYYKVLKDSKPAPKKKSKK